MRLFGWFRKKLVKEAIPLPVTLRERPAQVGSLAHAQYRLQHQRAQRDKWQDIVDGGLGGRNKTHEECVAALYAVSEQPYSGCPNKIAYWEAKVDQAQTNQQEQ